MGLTKEEWGRRLKAATELRGLDLQDLPPLIEDLKDDYNVAAHGPARAARAGDPQQPTGAMARASAAALQLPLEWFTEPDFDVWIASRRPEGEALESLAADYSTLVGELAAVRSDLAALRERQERDGRKRGGAGNG